MRDDFSDVPPTVLGGHRIGCKIVSGPWPGYGGKGVTITAEKKEDGTLRVVSVTRYGIGDNDP